MPEINVKQEIEKLNDELDERFQEINEREERIKALEEENKGTSELKEQVNEISEEVSERIDEIKALEDDLHERQDAFETEIQKILDGDGARRSGLDLKGKIEEAMEASNLSETRKGRASVAFKSWDQVKAITDAGGSGGPLLDEERVPDIIGPSERALRIRDLMPTAQTSETSIEYMEESSVTDNAGTQDPQGSVKGESDFAFQLSTEKVKTIAHFVKISTQMLDDVTALESYISTRMRFLLNQEEEDQLLDGDGSSTELNGLKTQATAYDETLDDDVSSLQQLDVIRAAMLQVQLAEYAPSGIILHPQDWFDIETLKDSDKNYLFVSPQSGGAPRLWGLPVVSTTAQTADEFTVGAFRMASQLWDRMMARVQISTEDDDNFQKNLATLRAEKREALTVYRPESVIDGDFSVALTGS